MSLPATAQWEDGAFFTPNLSVKKTKKDNRWGFQLQWLYIDAGLGISNRQRITTFGSDFYSTTKRILKCFKLFSRHHKHGAVPEAGGNLDHI